METKKREELRFANELISMLNIDATCTSCQDPPDIIINIRDKKIGLEITKLVVEGSFKKTSPLDTLIRDVEIEYAKRYSNSNHYLIVSTKKFNFKKPQSSQIIDEIILELHNFIEHSKSPTTYFSYIEIVPVVTPYLKIFHIYEAGYEPTISDNIIKEVVLKKEADVHRYKRNFDEIWLLLTMPDAGFISSEYHFPSKQDEKLSQISNSEFDHIFITRNSEIFKLK